MKISWGSLLPNLQPIPYWPGVEVDGSPVPAAVVQPPGGGHPHQQRHYLQGTLSWHADIVSIDDVTWLSSMLVQVLPGLPVFYAVLSWRRPHGDCSVSHRCTSPGPGHFRGTAVNLLSLLTNWVDGQNWGLQPIFLVRRLGFISQSNWLFWQ